MSCLLFAFPLISFLHIHLLGFCLTVNISWFLISVSSSISVFLSSPSSTCPPLLLFFFLSTQTWLLSLFFLLSWVSTLHLFLCLCHSVHFFPTYTLSFLFLYSLYTHCYTRHFSLCHNIIFTLSHILYFACFTITSRHSFSLVITLQRSCSLSPSFLS